MTEAVTERCRHFNSGYCKYKDRCRFFHNTKVCEGYCSNKKCTKRHPKKCRFNEQCRRGTNCLYKHTSNGITAAEKEYTLKLVNSKLTKSEKENLSLQAKIQEMKKILIITEKKLMLEKDKTTEYEAKVKANFQQQENKFKDKCNKLKIQVKEDQTKLEQQESTIRKLTDDVSQKSNDIISEREEIENLSYDFNLIKEEMSIKEKDHIEEVERKNAQIELLEKTVNSLKMNKFHCDKCGAKVSFK